MALQFEKIKEISPLNVCVGERYLVPTQKNIEKMAVSLQQQGQICPIIVCHITQNKYQLIVGATRLRAAIDILHWDKIRAEIVIGPPIDYKLFELTENIDRRDLTGAQRKQMRAKRKELLLEKLKQTPPVKGGRGKKGGLSQAAREAGVPLTTAHRDAKPFQTSDNGRVSPNADGASTAPADIPERSTAHIKYPLSTTYNETEMQFIEASAKQANISKGEFIRQCVRDRMRLGSISLVVNNG